MDRIVGGWQISGVGRIQTGELLDLRQRAPGRDDRRRTCRTQSISASRPTVSCSSCRTTSSRTRSRRSTTTSTGYGALGAPTGRYLAPANGPDCIEITPGFGAVRHPVSLVITAPRLIRFDLSAVKRIQLRGTNERRVPCRDAERAELAVLQPEREHHDGRRLHAVVLTPTYEGAAGRPADELDDDQRRQLPADDAARRQPEPRHPAGLEIQLVGRRSASSILRASWLPGSSARRASSWAIASPNCPSFASAIARFIRAST